MSRKRQLDSITKTKLSSPDHDSHIFDQLVWTNKKSKCATLQAYMPIKFSEFGEFTCVRSENWNLTFGRDETFPKHRWDAIHGKRAVESVRPEWRIPSGFVSGVQRIMRCFDVTRIFYKEGDGWKQYQDREPQIDSNSDGNKTPVKDNVNDNQPASATFRFNADVVWKQEIDAYGNDGYIEPRGNILTLVFTLKNTGDPNQTKKL